ncbi:MAG: DUF2630 family protein [Casimicrobiaceae bacterium]
MKQEQAEHPVLTHIQRLVAEEHRLMGQPSMADADHVALAALQVELDQCWDLLRQRRALREYGEDPGSAQIRPAGVVEKYDG